jgi:serine/threonine protein kinase
MNCSLPKCQKELKPKKAGNTIDTNIFKCQCCKIPFCSNSCIIEHLIFKDKELCNPVLIQQAKTQNPQESQFLKKGTLLNEVIEDPYFNYSNFEKVKVANKTHILGSGAFGQVFLAKSKIDGKLFAIKQMDKARLLGVGIKADIVYREINIHLRLQHENIAKLYSYHEDELGYYLIIEYVDSGTLFQTIQKNRGLSEQDSFKYFIQVANALNFLHENNLIHRDLKPENLLVDRNGVVKLCDFGWTVESTVGSRVTFCGTYEYMAPEIVKEKPYNKMIDVWSIGILLYELLHSYSPFRAKRQQLKDDNPTAEVFRNILKYKFTIEKDVSSECKDLIHQLLSPNMESRLCIRDIFNHPWVRSFETSKEQPTFVFTKLVTKQTVIKKKSLNDTLLSEITMASDNTNINKQYEQIFDQIQNSRKKKQSKDLTETYRKKLESVEGNKDRKSFSVSNTMSRFIEKENEELRNKKIILKVEKSEKSPKMRKISPIRKDSSGEIDQSNYSLIKEVTEIDREINKKAKNLEKFHMKKREVNDILESCSKYNSLKFPVSSDHIDENCNNMNFFYQKKQQSSTRDSTELYENLKHSKKPIKKQSSKKNNLDYNQQLYLEKDSGFRRKRISYSKTKKEDHLDLIRESKKALARSELIEQSIDTTMKSEISTQTDHRQSFWGNIFGYFKCAS